VDVNEQGTEAAAATYVVMAASPLRPPEPIEFRVDRPFLFLIVDKPTGTVLFVGRVLDPRP
jgi:serpin B